MKTEKDSMIQKMEKKIQEIKKSKKKAKEVLINSGIYTKNGKLKRQYQ